MRKPRDRTSRTRFRSYRVDSAEGVWTVIISDKEIALASSMLAAPGMYVAVLGAGASASAGIPIASQVTTTMIRRLASARGVEVADDWDASHTWYSATYSEEPTYEGILEKLAAAPGDRGALLEEFFRGRSTSPSKVHEHLAELARRGLIRVFVTTNFDDLMETALRNAGLDPYVVVTNEDAVNAVPLQRHDAVVIHVHGHWQQASSMRNTVDELGAYPDWVADIARDALRGYGRTIVGWAAGHDPELRALLTQHASQRFSCYWIDRANLEGKGAELALSLGAIPIIGSADVVLSNVLAAIENMEQFSRPAVTSDSINLTRAQAAMSRGDIQSVLTTLSAAVGKLESIEALNVTSFESSTPGPIAAVRALEIADAARESVLLVALLALHGDPKLLERWTQHAARLGQGPHTGGSTALIEQQRLPGLLLACCAGVCAAARNDPEMLAAVLESSSVSRVGEADEVPILLYDRLEYAFPAGFGLAAINAYLSDVLVGSGLVAQGEYEEAWDRFEVAWFVYAESVERPPSWMPHTRIQGYTDNYRPLAWPWMNRSYRIDTETQSRLAPHNQIATAERYLNRLNVFAHREAIAHAQSHQAKYPSGIWRIDEVNGGAAYAAARSFLIRAADA